MSAPDACRDATKIFYENVTTQSIGSMGQNQLLLLLLSVILVGLAIAVGIDSFDTAARQNQADDVMNRALRVAQGAIEWRARSETYGGGGGGGYDPLATDGFEAIGLRADISHTKHAILTASGPTLEIVGVSTAAPGAGAYVRLVGDSIVESRVVLDGSITLNSAGGD